MTDGSLDFMQLHNITPMSWNPLGSIFKEENTQTERLKTCLKNMSEKYDVDTDVLLLSWILKHPSGVLPVIGTTNQSRIKNALKAIPLEMDLEDWFTIWSESMGTKVP